MIPARSWDGHLIATLASIAAQVLPDGLTVETVVGLADEAPTACPDGVRVVHNPNGTIPDALNLAISESRGEVILRVDARCVLPPDYVTRVVDRLAAFYAEWLPPAAIRYIKPPDAAHAMISVADPQADACDSMQSPYINRCGDLDPAGEMLTHMLGPLQPPDATAQGEMLQFEQGDFVDGKAIDAGLADEAYVYVPRDCRNTSCRIHVAFHGCRQSSAQIGRRFVDGAGYNRWADSNRIIVLYPQTVPRYGLAIGSWKWMSNPLACWDWWGYSGRTYPTRDGVQIRAVRAMLERLAAPRQP